MDLKTFHHGELNRVASCAPNGITPFPTADRPEVAFVGRSNVGKSSLINSLVAGRKIARTSGTPGATRGVHFFNLADEIYIVDLPGYGFAKLPHDVTEKLGTLVNKYMGERETLRCTYVLIDARRGLKEMDHELLLGLAEAQITAQAVITKLDKLKAPGQAHIIAQTNQWLTANGLPAAIATSASKGTGMVDLQKDVLHKCKK